jgi:hypothetical protein
MESVLNNKQRLQEHPEFQIKQETIQIKVKDNRLL